nr:unnamed protein product [Digitaria exilis]
MGAGEDRISGLPDELLHGIFLRLGSVRDAVRAGVVSRRWRHVLGRPLPELVFEQDLHDHEPPPRPPRLEPFLDSVDAALAACDAPVVKRLRIYWMWCGPLSMAAASRLPTGRVEPWLRFASERVVDFLDLHVHPPGLRGVNGEGGVIDLPLCEWVKGISVGFGTGWRIRPPSAGLFQALTELTIRDGCMDGSELTALVCTQCPGLKKLHLCLRLVDAFDISIRSDSLQSLWFGVQKTRRLEIVAPELEKLSVILAIDEVQITAPKLEELVWPKFDPSCHGFDDVGRHLRMLEPGRKSGSLMQQFDEVDDLRLTISIPQELDGYESFLDETNWLPK